MSLAVLLRGKLAARDFVPYLVAQVAGAVTAGLIAFVTPTDSRSADRKG